MILAITLALGFWHYNPNINEFQYSIPVGHTVQMCGAVGVAGDGLFYADIVRPRIAEKIQGREFQTLGEAQAFVARQCR
jgi:hypothetical protein